MSKDHIDKKKTKSILDKRKKVYPENSNNPPAYTYYLYPLLQQSGSVLKETLTEEFDFFKQASKLIHKARKHNLDLNSLKIGIQAHLNSGYRLRGRVGLVFQETEYGKSIGRMYNVDVIEIPFQIGLNDWTNPDWCFVCG